LVSVTRKEEYSILLHDIYLHCIMSYM